MRQVLQNVTKAYYKVCQVLKSMSGITKCERSLLQSVTGITKCERSLLQSVTGITKCKRSLLQSVSGITKCERSLLQTYQVVRSVTGCCYKVRNNGELGLITENQAFQQ